MSNHMQWNHPLMSGGGNTSSCSDATQNQASPPLPAAAPPAKSKVALASKNARERRKKEFETLVEENQKLREEREKYLQRIEFLQLKVVEMRENEGDIDLQLENELLKAQLSEHSMFVNGLIKMSDGVPTSALEKKQLYRQGADYANVHITSLLTRSVRLHDQWQTGKMPPSGADLNLSVCFQHVLDPASGARRLNMRTDQIFTGSTAEIVSSMYWSLWTNNDVVRGLIQDSNLSANGLSTSTVLHSDELDADMEESLATVYTRDETQHHVFVASKRETSIARGSLALPIDGDAVQGELAQPWKRRKCKMCARSNTNVNRLQETRGSGAASKQELTNPSYVEGCAVWDLDGGEKRCRVAAVLSIVDGFKIGSFSGFELISEDGCVSESFVALSRSFSNMVHQGIEAAATSNKRLRIEEEERV